MKDLIFSGHPLVFVPKCDATIRPADGQGLEDWVPLQAHRLGLASLDLKVWKLSAFFVDEDHSWLIRGNSQDHVEVVVAPSRHDCILTLRQGKVAVKK